jgi:hypothetical protein
VFTFGCVPSYCCLTLNPCPTQVTVLMRQPVGGERPLPADGPGMLNGLELRLEGELIQTRRIVRIEVANHSEVSAAKFSTAVP